MSQNDNTLVSQSRLINEFNFKARMGRLLVQWEFILLILLIAEVLFFSSQSPYFLDYFNLMNATFTFSEKAILALPMMFIIISGDIDISVAGIISLCSFAMGWMSSKGFGTGAIILAGLLAGVAAGAFNGFFITKFKMPAIAVTLASTYLFRGIPQAILKDKAFTEYPDSFAYLGQGYVFNTIIPFQFVFFLILAVIMGFILHKTTYGRKVFVIGNSSTAGLFSGIRVDRIRFINFMITGLFAGISAILLTSRIGSTRPNIALGFELEVITLVVLGGVSITGGKGNILGVLLGIFFIGYLKFGMGLLNISAKIMIITTGMLLIFAVLLPGILDRIKSRRKIMVQKKQDGTLVTSSQ